ncbi:MAG: hypothetical protein C4523_03925 [Myxococcales bacterium]|nr:MAG: hypothetical protein C4523_03925 [Myxococcales bacterium]
MPNSVAATLVARLVSGRLDALLDRHVALLARIDKRWREAVKQGEARLPCRPGDCACCCGVFEAPLLDALALARWLRWRGATTEEARRARLQSEAATAAGWPFPHFFGDAGGDRMETALAALDDAPCALLTAEGVCAAYADRPSICRFQGFRFADPKTGATLDDACPRRPAGPALAFDLETYDAVEASLFAALVESVPGLGARDIGQWDVPIATAVLWGLET